MHSLHITWYRAIVFNQMTDETMIAKMKIIAIIIYYGKREQNMRYRNDIGTICIPRTRHKLKFIIISKKNNQRLHDLIRSKCVFFQDKFDVRDEIHVDCAQNHFYARKV